MINGLFLEKGEAENLKDFGETAIDVELLFDDRHEQVDADGNPDLRLHSILACSVESLDAQVLLDPLEEDLNVPSTLVQLSVFCP